MKLLITEDDVFFRRLLEQILAGDYELILAVNSNEAWTELQRKNGPRLAILDWVMPGLTGPQVCRLIRQCPIFFHVRHHFNGQEQRSRCCFWSARIGHTRHSLRGTPC